MRRVFVEDVADPQPEQVHVASLAVDETLCGKRLARMLAVSADSQAGCQACLTAESQVKRHERRRHIEADPRPSKSGRKAEYAAYLKSEAWQRKRRLVINRCGNVCEGCGEAPVAQVHHKTYDHVFKEFLWELLGLCRGCHDRVHHHDEPAYEAVDPGPQTLLEARALRKAAKTG